MADHNSQKDTKLDFSQSYEIGISNGNIRSISILLFAPAYQKNMPPRCLTGYMTDVQSWVDAKGSLTDKVDVEHSMDLSSNPNPSYVLHNERSFFKYSYLRYLSMARCGMTRMPNWFDTIIGLDGRPISETLEYLSLYGNNFLEVSPTGEAYEITMNATDARELVPSGLRQNEDAPIWSHGLFVATYRVLRELDLRACGIETLTAPFFANMQQLEALYLGENAIHLIQETAFFGLDNLLHLDLSRNFMLDANSITKSLLIESPDAFVPLKKLKSLDFSHTRMNQRNVAALRNLGRSLERLSLCLVGPMRFGEYFLKSTSLKILDLSGNHNVLSSHSTLHGLESTLEVLYATDIGLSTFDYFENFHKLQILRVARNEITTVRKNIAATLHNLKVLDLSHNRVSSWFETVFSRMPSLEFLEIMNNNINVISDDMMTDFANVSFLGMSGNSLVCNCRSKDLIVLAARNEMQITPHLIKPSGEPFRRFGYHAGFENVNKNLALRKNISFLCENGCEGHLTGKVLFTDYKSGNYICFLMGAGRSVPLMEVTGCEEERKNDITSNLNTGWNKLLILLLLPGVLLILLVGFLFRRNLRYFYVTLRNSAMLSMVNKNKIIGDDTIFNYDVFVSYCNEDRAWVLDQLLSHLENDCSVSLCLHERDFQVGLSILENIVSCMDRSKFIMLVLSQQFLLSQWCQFEMHLAQHRLLETRREDLILILLEDIPRRLRPNNLHYLMLTKTYIVWPKNKSEQHLFWKRLKKSVIAQKQKRQDNVSLT